MTRPRVGVVELCFTPAKVAHVDEDSALRQLADLRAHGKDDGLTVPYRCRCRAWHLGHPRELPDLELMLRRLAEFTAAARPAGWRP